MRWLAVIALAGCGDPAAAPDAGPAPDADGDQYHAGTAALLSEDSPGNDEDPAVLRAADGSIYVAWYSQGAGNDIVIARTTDGVTWSAPAHVTSGAAIDFGPSLAQAPDGTLHLAFFRWPDGAPPGKIVHVTSSDGETWSAGVDVTDANATDDWVPTLAFDAAGDVVVAFARNTCPPPDTCYGIAAARSTDGGDTWATPVTVVAAGAGLEHHLPALARDGDELALVWNPYDDAADTPYDNVMTGAHLSVIRSAGADVWTGATDLTSAQTDAIDVFPTLYADHAGALHAAWMQADLASNQAVVEVPLASPTATPRALPHDGYSPRLVATPTDGLYLGAWVGGVPGEREIYVRVFGH